MPPVMRLSVPSAQLCGNELRERIVRGTTWRLRRVAPPSFGRARGVARGTLGLDQAEEGAGLEGSTKLPGSRAISAAFSTN